MESLSNFSDEIEKMSESDKRELGNVVNNEMQKAKIQECMFSPPSPFPRLSPFPSSPPPPNITPSSQDMQPCTT